MNSKFQNEVNDVVIAAWGGHAVVDEKERIRFFTKKALEFLKSLGATGVSGPLLNEVFGTANGNPLNRAQEAGGVAFTFAALCNAFGLNLEDCANAELDRVRVKHGVERPEVSDSGHPAVDPEAIAREQALLTIASHYQGGNSKEGAQIAAALNIACPLSMENLALYAVRRGYNPDELWPWLAEMNPRLTRAALAAGVDPTLPVMEFGYRNHRNEYAIRAVAPVKLWYGSTEWHPENQWFLKAFDYERQEERDFAFDSIGYEDLTHIPAENLSTEPKISGHGMPTPEPIVPGLPKPEPAWTEWAGGENPAPDAIVEIQMRDGSPTCRGESRFLRWNHNLLDRGETGGDIVRYRVVG